MNRINCIFASRLVSTIADQLLFFLIPLVVYKTTGSAALSGLSFALEWIPRVMAFLIAGLWGDRIGGSHLYIKTDVYRGCLIVLFLSVLLLGYGSAFWSLTLMGAGIGYFSSQAQVSLEMTVKGHFDEKDIPTVQAKLQMCEQLSLIIGPLLAGALLGLMPYTIVMGGVGALFFTAALISRMILSRDSRHAIKPDNAMSPAASFKRGIHLIWHSKPLRLLVLFSILANFFYGVILTLNPAIIKGVFHASDQQLSWMYAIAGLVTIAMLSLVVWLTRFLSVKQIGFIGIFIFLSSAISLSFAPFYEMYALFYALLIAGVMLTNVMTRTYRVQLIPNQEFGITVGIILFLIKTAMPLSGFFVLLFAKSLNLQHLILLSVIGSVVIFLTQLPFFLKESKKVYN